MVLHFKVYIRTNSQLMKNISFKVSIAHSLFILTQLFYWTVVIFLVAYSQILQLILIICHVYLENNKEYNIKNCIDS